jgi:hypothetical protein
VLGLNVDDPACGCRAQLYKINRATPNPALTATPALVSTGDPIALDASGSTADLATISKYEWDLDGDGTYETDTGTDPKTSTTYLARGTRTVGVRVTTDRGGAATTTAEVDVRAAAPSGPVGVSINKGAQFTNDPDVAVSTVWPKFATDLVISNDGGFQPSKSFQVDPTIPWTLDSSGPERLPKTIYVRFSGGQSGAETYQDDIILDQTPPDIDDIAVTVASSSSAAVAAVRRYELTLDATDNVSGVAGMQLARDRDSPPAFIPYKRRTTYAGALPVHVRVRDFAGNLSAWRTVRGGFSGRGANIRIRGAGPGGTAKSATVRRGVARFKVINRNRFRITGKLTLKRGLMLGRRTLAVAPQTATVIKLKLTAAGRRLLRRQAPVKAMVAVKATDPLGGTRTARRGMLLRTP